MLEAEHDSHLGYKKHDVQNKQTTNSRNGKSKKTNISEYGEHEIEASRDRQGEFERVVVKKHQSTVTGIKVQIVALYGKGVSTRNIQDHLEQLYGVETHSPQQGMAEPPVAEPVAVVFLEAIHFKVKQDGDIVNKAAYMVIGIDLDGNKDVLGMWIGENEAQMAAAAGVLAPQLLLSLPVYSRFLEDLVWRLVIV